MNKEKKEKKKKMKNQKERYQKEDSSKRRWEKRKKRSFKEEYEEEDDTEEEEEKKRKKGKPKKETTGTRWTPKQIKLLTTTFYSHLKKGIYPSTIEIQKFCAKNNIQREPIVSSPRTDSDSAFDLADHPLSPFFLARSLPLRGNPGFPAFSSSSWPVPSHCEGTPAFPLPPFLPGPFPPIAREPRPSRFLLSSWPVPSRCEGTPAIPLSLHPPFSGPETGSSVQVRPEQEEPAASRSDRKDSKYEPRSPPTPARNTPPGHGHRPRKPPLLRHLLVLLPLFRALTADPRTPYAPQSYPGRVASHHSRKKGLATDPNGVKSRDVTTASDRHNIYFIS
ncbi:hypothetical protein GEV33_001469 [Tenebrio molitor]|uniref:Uncharacterized protein n=1 Tax=Tenebrio molitor TaxID=7067 RepID=A0A8J6HW09_TENMO|nr:hypothetical protein GEV33_001469 [Tenebrio molitor]